MVLELELVRGEMQQIKRGRSIARRRERMRGQETKQGGMHPQGDSTPAVVSRYSTFKYPNDVQQEWADLLKRALPASSVGTEPYIFYGLGVRAEQRRNAPPPGATTAGETVEEVEEDGLGDEARGDVSARGFHTRRRVTIFDVRISDTDAPSYRNKTSAKVLEAAEKEKSTKYEAACAERQRDFVPLVYLVDGLPGQRTKTAERRLATMLAAKWERPYLDVVIFFRVRMSLAVVRANTLPLRTERAKSNYQRRAPEGVEACISGRG